MQGNPNHSPLTQVVSIREAAELYGVTTQTIRYHLDRGNLRFRQLEKGVYLIEYASLVRLSRRLHGSELKGLSPACICFEVR